MEQMMRPCSLSFASDLFEICRKDHVGMSCEVKLNTQPNNFITVLDEIPAVDYVESDDEGPDSFVVNMGAAEFGFDLPIQCSMWIADTDQIEIAIATENYAAFFMSSRLSTRAMFKARNMKETDCD